MKNSIVDKLFYSSNRFFTHRKIFHLFHLAWGYLALWERLILAPCQLLNLFWDRSYDCFYETTFFRKSNFSSSQKGVLQSPWIPKKRPKHLQIFSSAKNNHIIGQMMKRKSKRWKMTIQIRFEFLWFQRKARRMKNSIVGKLFYSSNYFFT